MKLLIHLVKAESKRAHAVSAKCLWGVFTQTNSGLALLGNPSVLLITIEGRRAWLLRGHLRAGMFYSFSLETNYLCSEQWFCIQVYLKAYKQNHTEMSPGLGFPEGSCSNSNKQINK